jgi:hypothetical protein
MSRTSVLARARAFALAGFADTCTVKRVTSVDTNPLTAVVTKTYQTLYSGACRVQTAGGAAGLIDVGQAAPRSSSATLQLPVVGSEGIRPDDIVTIVTCVNDTELVGRIYHITGEHHASQKSARRLAMDEVIS